MAENQDPHKNGKQHAHNGAGSSRRSLSDKQFRKIEEVLDTLILQAPAIICSFLVVDGEWDIKYVSDNIETVTGLKPQDFTGKFKAWASHVHPDDRDRLLADMRRHTKNSGIQTLEYRLKNSKGKYQWIHDQQRVVEDKDGRIEIVSAWWDFTNRRKVVEALQQSELRFQKLLSLVPDMISIQDTQMNIVYSNWSGIGEIPEEKRVLGTKCYKTYRGYDDICRDCHAISVLDTREVHQEERELPDGRWIRLRVAPILDDKNNVEYFVEWIRDITESKQAEKKLEHLATTDDLTGLWNRRHFMNSATGEFERARRYGQYFSLLMIDIDYFKKLNDTHGHAAGDAVLRHLAGMLKGSMRRTDITGRVGGEEFSIILPNTGIENAELLAERLRLTVEKSPASYSEKTLFLTVSIGLTAYSPGFESIDEMLLLADNALYEAKEGGRNRVVIKSTRRNP